MRFFLSVLALGFLTYWFLKPTDSLPSRDKNNEILAIKENTVINKKNEDKNELKKNSDFENIKSTVGSKDDKSSSTKLKSEHLKIMSEKIENCLEIKNSLISESDPAIVDQLLQSVQTELGEPIVRTEDWVSFEVKLQNGQRKLNRVDTQYEGQDIVKQLKQYQIIGNELRPMTLSFASLNPSEETLKALENEGELISKDKGERIFFHNGEELNYSEKNGFLVQAELIKQGKSLRCDDFGKSSFKCQCF